MALSESTKNPRKQCMLLHSWCRTHAYDQEKTDGSGARGRRPHCGRTVLHPGRLSPSPPVISHPKLATRQKLQQNLLACTDCIVSDLRCTGSRLCPGWCCKALVRLPCPEPVPGYHRATAEQGRIAQKHQPETDRRQYPTQ